MEKGNKVVDRRIQRTKKLLWDSLISLILMKGYDQITIQDIIDEANIGRSTFYSHYENKEQLLFSGQPHLTEMLFQQGEEGTRVSFTTVFRHAWDNKDVAKALFGKQSGHILLNHIHDVVSLKLKDVFESIGTQKKDTSPKKEQFLIEATAAALVSLLSNWIENDMKIPIEEMDAMSKEILNAMSRVHTVY